MKSAAEIFENCRVNYKLHLCAGRSGLGRGVSWIHQAEDLRSLDLLHGGELVVTTGLTSQGDPEWFARVLDLLSRRNASGLIVNVGMYIESADITAEIRAGFDNAEMPLLLMPWDINIPDLMQTVSNSIFKETQKDDMIGSIFADMLLDSPIRTAQALSLEEYGFCNDARYNVLCISGLRSVGFVDGFMQKNGIKYHILHSQDTSIVIFECPDDDIALSLSDAILSHYGQIRGNTATPDGPVIGMGEAEYALSRIKFSYINAKNALQVAQSKGTNFFRFRDLGFYQVLLSIEDTDLLMRLRREYLGPLEESDRANGTQYVETLFTYLECRSSVIDTASRMHTHRNTINYRIRKIREMLPFDMDDPECIFMMRMALYIRNNLI